MTRRSSRRQFLAQVGIGGAALSFAAPRIARTAEVNQKLTVGFVGVGGQAGTHVNGSSGMGLNCICFAETDKSLWNGVLNKRGWDKAVGYTDWRQMFEKHGKDLNVVFVAVPDHSHFAPSMTAVSMGISCYTEKPLTWGVKEAQLLAAAYAKNTKAVTQMGNQGHAGNGWRVAYEFVKAGAIGNIVEFHTWTNRPIWPQGGDRPTRTDPVPQNIDWEAWIGAAPMRPFTGGKTYHPFNWRGFVDFGSGALGDMACHTTDGIYAIMEPGYAATAEPIFMSGPVKDQFPSGMTIKMTFRAKEGKDARPGFTTFWYEGNVSGRTANMPATPAELKADGRNLPRTGNLVVGTKGKMLVEGDYWNTTRLIPEAKMKEFGKPKQLLERSPGHTQEFIAAVRGEKPREFSKSNWGYSGPMAANIQLGNLCARAGKKIELNEAGKITNDAAIDALAWREPRKGWGPLVTNV